MPNSKEIVKIWQLNIKSLWTWSSCPNLFIWRLQKSKLIEKSRSKLEQSKLW